MTAMQRCAQGIRGLHRGYKAGFVLAAAWSPIFFTRSPWLAAGMMASCTAAFFIATRHSTPETHLAIPPTDPPPRSAHDVPP